MLYVKTTPQIETSKDSGDRHLSYFSDYTSSSCYSQQFFYLWWWHKCVILLIFIPKMLKNAENRFRKKSEVWLKASLDSLSENITANSLAELIGNCSASAQRVSWRFCVYSSDSTENVALHVIAVDPLVEGDNVTLKCVADGNPAPTSFNFHLKVLAPQKCRETICIGAALHAQAA